MVLRIAFGLLFFAGFFLEKAFSANAGAFMNVPQPHERTLSYYKIRRGDQALVELFREVSRTKIKMKSTEQWENTNASYVCSQNVCVNDKNVTCLRAVVPIPGKKCQEFQRQKILKNILVGLNSGNCVLPSGSNGGQQPSGNNPFQSGPNFPADDFDDGSPFANYDTFNNRPQSAGGKTFRPNPQIPVQKPGAGGGGVRNPFIPAAITAGAVGALAHYNTLGDDVVVNPHAKIGFSPGKPGVRSNSPPKPGRPSKPFIPLNDQYKLDKSCSVQSMFNLGRKYHAETVRFIKQDDDNRHSFDPDKSTESLFDSSLEMLNVALLSKSDSVKRSSVFIVKEWVDVYFSSIDSYFPMSLKAILDKACNCFLDEEKPSYVNEKLKAFLNGAGYYKK